MSFKVTQNSIDYDPVQILQNLIKQLLLFVSGALPNVPGLFLYILVLFKLFAE